MIRGLTRVDYFIPDRGWKEPRDLTCVSMLYKGKFSEVWKVSRDDIKDQDGNPVFVAAKVFKKNKNTEAAVKKEVRLMRNSENKNSVEFFVLYENDDSYIAITELGDGGSLAKFLEMYKAIKEKDAAYIIKQILDALWYMHRHDIMHRGVKPENILFKNRVEYDSETGLKENKILLCDFGSADRLKTSKSKISTSNYAAPEILKGKEYTNNVDIWAVGIITYEMLYGECPSNTGAAFLKSISMFSDAKDFIRKCMAKDASRRMSAEQALQHEWIRKNTTENTGEYSKLKQGVSVLKGKKKENSTSESARKYGIESRGSSTERLIP